MLYVCNLFGIQIFFSQTQGSGIKQISSLQNDRNELQERIVAPAVAVEKCECQKKQKINGPKNSKDLLQIDENIKQN